MSADLGIFPLHGTARRSPAADARYLHPAALPHWRALLECRLQEHHAKVAELGPPKTPSFLPLRSLSVLIGESFRTKTMFTGEKTP